MKLVVFGLTITTSWGNGHATLWRGLAAALARRGHRLEFFERDLPYYAPHRDLLEVPGRGALHLYREWDDRAARASLRGADAAIVTSYCPDGPAAAAVVADCEGPVKIFYDMDTPVTVERAQAGLPVEYIGPRGLRDFDVVLSFTGGRALDALRDLFGARRTATLYGSVDPNVHRPADAIARFRGDFSYLGTWAENRQHAVEQLFLEPARRMPDRRFMLAGAQYPADFPWAANIFYVNHLPPAEHPAFFCSSPLTLNVTRAPMAAMGHCPSGRLFEAAACGVPVLTDWWEGIEAFFRPGEEILVARGPEDVVAAVSRSAEELARIGHAARERALQEHTAVARADELIRIIEAA
ncbi:MAG: glycosyltransferase [Myxococcales bacterium]